MTDQLQSIEYFKEQSKQLYRQVKAGEVSALTRAGSAFSELGDFSLMNAQHVVTTEYGFSKWEELLKATPTQLRLAITMQKVSRLTDFGMGVYGERRLTKDEYVEEFTRERHDLRESHSKVREIVDWLQKHVTPIKTINRNRTSYGMKHIAEKDLGYVTNGQFIAAAIICGYGYKIFNDSPNVCFAMSEKSFSTLRARE